MLCRNDFLDRAAGLFGALRASSVGLNAVTPSASYIDIIVIFGIYLKIP
jgi:hypothetical protein